MGDFLLPAALKVIVEDYQQGLLDCLNEQIKVMPLHLTFTQTLRINGVWAGRGQVLTSKI